MLDACFFNQNHAVHAGMRRQGQKADVLYLYISVKQSFKLIACIEPEEHQMYAKIYDLQLNLITANVITFNYKMR